MSDPTAPAPIPDVTLDGIDHSDHKTEPEDDTASFDPALTSEDESVADDSFDDLSTSDEHDDHTDHAPAAPHYVPVVR